MCRWKVRSEIVHTVSDDPPMEDRLRDDGFKPMERVDEAAGSMRRKRSQRGLLIMRTSMRRSNRLRVEGLKEGIGCMPMDGTCRSS